MGHKLTKEDIYAIRHADDLSVGLTSRFPDGIVRLIKRRDYQKPFDQDQEYILENAAVTMNGYGWEDKIKSGEYVCHDLVGIYHGQGHHVSSVLNTLKEGDELTFRFYPDCNLNQYTKEGEYLHADALFLDVRRTNKRGETKRIEWKIASSICPDNSARMCRGVPFKPGAF